MKRYELIKSPKDLDRLRDVFVRICENQLCTDCIYLASHGIGTVGCFAMWLKEEIEVEEE